MGVLGALAGLLALESGTDALTAPPRVEYRDAGPYDSAQGWEPRIVDEDGRPIGFDPCSEVHYVASLAAAPPSALADLHEAARQVGEAAGLRMVFDGVTDELPRSDRPAYQPERYGDRWAPVLVSWVRPSQTDLVFGADEGGVAVGLGGGHVEVGPDGPVLVTGDLTVNGDALLPPGFAAGTTQGEVLLHEWGHVLGLAHVTDTRQVMSPATLSTAGRLGEGDRAGLAAVTGTACRRPPPPSGDASPADPG